ncbi:helix-turn-helix domain-containing protein [Dactylosporangium aurantiacum]|uniref:Helix-turn-helix domain-containing protein n=1 Tax=Dactylosporangium aurantiacum TaxID=35754 RepID=A0A9Q9II02_9ACTN|nr:helix-turn-helix domain-containing protein [Dactylosporangium aurantiacum]MDG6104387.1 helix-turn-helix domain-containing protein [Dactylosporangium aurantiacum]UWZ56011.1 helix-turn-helix domain-containing protein [Dactylosporangium aurantiacum]
MSSNVLPFTPRNSDPADAPERATPATVTRAVYTVAEVAELLSLSTGSTYALVRKGDIPAMKLGGRWVIPVRRFETWLNNLPTASTDDLDRELAALDRAAGRDRTHHGA